MKAVHLQQEGDLSFCVEPLLVGSHPHQDAFVKGEVMARSGYVVESGALAALAVRTAAGRHNEVREAQVTMTVLAEYHVILQLGRILGNLGQIFNFTYEIIFEIVPNT